MSGNLLSLRVEGSESAGPDSYNLRLRKLPDVPWPLPFESVEFVSNSLTRETFTGPLKVFEDWMRRVLGIEDLVQLNGYYQNKSILGVEFTSKSDSQFGFAYSQLINGLLAGEILPSSRFEELLFETGDTVDEVMDTLRGFGFEVRNSNTNPQIPEGHYLVPYLFPTLNIRSMQRKKSLR
jgi:DNA (cytosine-5)-methyltransferase 1